MTLSRKPNWVENIHLINSLIFLKSLLISSPQWGLLWLYLMLQSAHPRLPGWLSGKESTCQCRRLWFGPWVRKIPWRRAWLPMPIFLSGEFHGQRSLLGYSPAAAAAKSLQSCPTLCDPIDGSPPGSAIPGILQARTPEWVAISFSNAWKWKVKVKSLSRVWLLATPWTAAYQAPPSMGFSKQEYWSGVPLPSPRLQSTGLQRVRHD